MAHKDGLQTGESCEPIDDQEEDMEELKTSAEGLLVVFYEVKRKRLDTSSIVELTVWLIRDVCSRRVC